MNREPEKGKIEFEIKWDEIQSSDLRAVVEKIESVSERLLYNWRSFPIQLPHSIVDDKNICLKDLFILPIFDELDSLADSGDKGKPQFLSHNQLESIKRKGQFSVQSKNFPGQFHVWKLNPFFQKGISTSKEEYLDGLALALRFLTVYVPQLILGESFSIRQSIKCLKNEIIELIDLIIGFGKVYSPNLEQRIQDERCKYLVAELKVKGEKYKDVGRYIRNQSNKALREKVTLAMERPPSIPYKFSTPVNLDVDLRLFDRDVIRKVNPSLTRISEKASKGWFLSFREKVIAELKTRKLSENEVELEANRMVMDEYLRRVYNLIRSCPEITETGQSMDRLLFEQAQLFVLMNRAVDTVALKIDSELLNVKKCLMGERTVMSRDSQWMKMKLRQAQKKICNSNKWLPHEISLELCKQNYLKQHSYFLSRDLTFMRDRYEILKKEFYNDKIPCKSYEWKTLIWFPRNYVIKRTLHGNTDVIPTLPVYNENRTITRTTTSRWPLWRINNIIFRSFTWILNVMYFLGFIIPWCSQLSLRALFHKSPFIPEHEVELSQVNGTLCPKKSSQIKTLTTRLINIWTRVGKGIEKFESQPDVGFFLGKGWNRLINRIWNYIFKGFIPTAVFVIFFPLGSLILSLSSFALAITAPLWIPPIVLIFHFICVFAYDIDCPMPERPKYVPFFLTMCSLILQGLFQMFLCLLGIIFICPIISVSIFIWTIFHYGLRLSWDSLMFYSLLKPNGRLPSTNSWIVKRILGPGLAPDFYFEISIEHALIAFQVRLEIEELNLFHQKTKRIINQPVVEFKSYFESIFAPFSSKLVENEGPFKDLIRETHILRDSLDEKCLKRRNDLETNLNVTTRSKIRMSKNNLEKTLRSACHMAKDFFPLKIFSKMESQDEISSYWESKGLEENDYTNLVILLLTEIFCPDFLSPLNDLDIYFPLQSNIKANPLPTELYMDTLEQEYWETDQAEVPVTKSKVKYQIHSPFLDISAFNPMSRSFNIIEDNHIGNYLSIPLPILHPAFISVIIYNRETDNPFSLDNPISRAILKALQDSGPMLNQDCISLSLSESDDDSDYLGQTPQTREDILIIETPSPLNLTTADVNLWGQSSPLSLPIASTSASINSPSMSSADGQEVKSFSGGESNANILLESSEDFASTSYSANRPPLLYPPNYSKRLNLGLNSDRQQQQKGNFMMKRKGFGNSSKVSLASPEEEIDLEEVVLSTYGTSV